jgi:radical SAM superfamily enzyme YgiQ (UPF0313 family)
MKVLLVNPPFPGKSNICPPLGLGYVGSSLLKAGFDAKILDCTLGNADLDFILSFFRPEWVGITGMTSQYPAMKEFARVSKRFGSKVVFGGIHSSAIPEFVMADCPDVDYVVKGEG